MPSFKDLFLIMCISVSVHVNQLPGKARKGLRVSILGEGVTGDYELQTSTGNWAWVFCKNSVCSQMLSHLSRLS